VQCGLRNGESEGHLKEVERRNPRLGGFEFKGKVSRECLK